eukprot:TRINITY_DN20818_c0_g1_i1.p2 TRINITY_DN20818_c0_g1~~TRINITY_DN20818_c0_g1_i1.p2  ORF type:complete len:400 (+),score=56.49 TRINITY_DN20818_c0_g1_i1:55-1200(+)
MFEKFRDAKQKKDAREEQSQQEIFELMTQLKRVNKLLEGKDTSLGYLQQQLADYGNLPIFNNGLPHEHAHWMNEKLRLLTEIRNHSETQQGYHSTLAPTTQAHTLDVLNDANTAKKKIDEMDARLHGNTMRHRILSEIIDLRALLQQKEDDTSRLMQEITQVAEQNPDVQGIDEIISLLGTHVMLADDEDDNLSQGGTKGTIDPTAVQIAMMASASNNPNNPLAQGSVSSRIHHAADIWQQEKDQERQARMNEHTLADEFRRRAVFDDQQQANRAMAHHHHHHHGTTASPTASDHPPASPHQDMAAKVDLWKRSKKQGVGLSGTAATTGKSVDLSTADDDTMFSDSSYASKVTMGQLLAQALEEEERKARAAPTHARHSVW